LTYRALKKVCCGRRYVNNDDLAFEIFVSVTIYFIVFIQVQTKMKAKGFTSRTDFDCSSKWRNLKKTFKNLNPLSLQQTDKERQLILQKQSAWPFWLKMKELCGENPTITLENVVEVVEGNAKPLKPKVIKFVTVTLGLSINK
jgi:hypothetical protein